MSQGWVGLQTSENEDEVQNLERVVSTPRGEEATSRLTETPKGGRQGEVGSGNGSGKVETGNPMGGDGWKQPPRSAGVQP
jgi:hypothetical protein